MSLIELSGIGKVYRTKEIETTALENVNISIEKGEFVSIMGPSGCGKSTLLNIIGLLDKPTSGSVRLLDTDCGTLGDTALSAFRNRNIGFVFQSFHLIPSLNVEANVELPLDYRTGIGAGERRERVGEVLERLGIAHRRKHLPSQLSGGQCQRVAIARAIVGRPKLLLADEPTGALDSAAGNQIMDIFDALNDTGSTIIMITHEQEIAERAKRINYIRDGILSDGRRDGESLA